MLKVIVNDAKEYEFSVPDEVAVREFAKQILFEKNIKKVQIFYNEQEILLDGGAFNINPTFEKSNFKIIVDEINLEAKDPLLAFSTAINYVILGAETVRVLEIVGNTENENLPSLELIYDRLED